MKVDGFALGLCLILLTAGLTLGGAVWLATPAQCQGDCLPTFCGFDADCPGPCRCYVPQGKATGECF